MFSKSLFFGILWLIDIELYESIFVNLEASCLISLLYINVFCDNIEWNHLVFQNTKILPYKMLFIKLNMHSQNNTEVEGIKKVSFSLDLLVTFFSL